MTEKHKAVRGTQPKKLPKGWKINPTPDQIFKNMYFKFFADEAGMNSFADGRRKAGDKVYCTARPDGSFSACVFVR